MGSCTFQLYIEAYHSKNLNRSFELICRNYLVNNGFFEDDIIQKEEIEESWDGKGIHVSHDFTEKENVRHLEDLDG